MQASDRTVPDVSTKNTKEVWSALHTMKAEEGRSDSERNFIFNKWTGMKYLLTMMESTRMEVEWKKFGLTPRELAIVSAVTMGGYSNIAEYFKITEDCMKHSLSIIFDKLGVSSRLELAFFAVNQGLPLKSIEEPPAHPPEKEPTANDRIRLHALGVRWD
jgi:DNA-binding CsgD family transcriptional regulator